MSARSNKGKRPAREFGISSLSTINDARLSQGHIFCWNARYEVVSILVLQHSPFGDWRECQIEAIWCQFDLSITIQLRSICSHPCNWTQAFFMPTTAFCSPVFPPLTPTALSQPAMSCISRNSKRFTSFSPSYRIRVNGLNSLNRIMFITDYP